MDPTAQTDSAARILARDAARVKRMKWITIITWLLVAVCFVVGGLLEYVEEKGPILTESEVLWMGFALALSWILALFAILFTISYYIRSRNLTIRQIQMRLAGIEEQLRQISQDKPAAPEA
jgi:hypothetical protein